MSCIKGDQETAHRSSHASDARHGTHRSAWKHIRYRGEEIGRPSLMRSSSNAQQSDGSPLRMQMPDSEDGNDKAGAEEHRGETRSCCRKSQLAKRRGQPASADAAE